MESSANAAFHVLTMKSIHVQELKLAKETRSLHLVHDQLNSLVVHIDLACLPAEVTKRLEYDTHDLIRTVFNCDRIKVSTLMNSYTNIIPKSCQHNDNFLSQSCHPHAEVTQ